MTRRVLRGALAINGAVGHGVLRRGSIRAAAIALIVLPPLFGIVGIVLGNVGRARGTRRQDSNDRVRRVPRCRDGHRPHIALTLKPRAHPSARRCRP